MVLATLIFYFLLLAASGTLISNRIFKSSNWIFQIGSGMLLGPLGLLLTAGLLSYIFKGFTALTLIFFSYIALVIYLFVRGLNLKKVRTQFIRSLTKHNLLISSLLFFYLLLILMVSSTFNLGGDFDVYSGIITSFARGNYPSYLPWQDHFLTSYHMGVFIVEGVIYAITQISTYSIHIFFSAYIISSLFLLLTGIAKQRCNSVAAITPAVLGVIVFALPVFLVGGYMKFFSNLSLLRNYPQFVDFKGAIGSGTADFFGMIYRNFYPFALSTFILAIYSLSQHSWGNKLYRKYILATIFLILTVSIDESFFFIQLFATSFYFVLDFYRQPLIKIVKLLAMLFACFISLFFLLQNSVRDALLNPSLENTRFKLLIPGGEQKSKFSNKSIMIPGDQEFIQHIKELDEKGSGKSAVIQMPWQYIWKNLGQLSGLTKQVGNTIWFLPNVLGITLAVLFLSVLIRSKMAILLSIASLITIALSQLIVYTFFPPTSIRFIHQAIQLATLAFGFAIVSLWCKRNSKFFKSGLLLMVLATLGPQFISSHVRVVNYYFENASRNYYAPYSPYYQSTLKNIRALIPYNGQIIFVDSYPLESGGSIVSEAIARFGFFVPVAPPDVKVVSPEGASEYVDVTLSLNPPALKKLGVKYVFIQYPARDRLANYGVDIQNPNFFKQIYSDNFGALFEVLPLYLELPSQPNSLDKFISDISPGKTIYLDRFKLLELRRGLVLRLAKKSNLIGPGFSGGGDYFLYIETLLPFTYICEVEDLPKCGPTVTSNFEPVDYIITSPDKNISEIIDGDYIKIKQIPLVTLWGKSEKY